MLDSQRENGNRMKPLGSVLLCKMQELCAESAASVFSWFVVGAWNPQGSSSLSADCNASDKEEITVAYIHGLSSFFLCQQ